MKHKGIFKRLSLLTLLLIAGFTSAMAQSLYMEGFKINAGDTKTVTVALATDGYDIYGLQTDIVLSNGLYLDGDPVAVEGAMADPNPSISCKWMDNKTIRVVMLSLNAKVFMPGKTNVIQLNVGCTENFVGGTIKLTNSHLTISNYGDEVSVPDYKAIVTTDKEVVIPDGLWSIPDPSSLLEFTMFEPYERYILYNPDAKMFFASGNGWSTMASLRTFGMEIWLDEPTEFDAPEGSYSLWDNNVNNPVRQTYEGNMFTDDNGTTWVDHGSQSNYSWAYEIVDGCVRLQNVAFIAAYPQYEGTYLGFDGNYELVGNDNYNGDRRDAYTAILRHVNPSAEGASVDWKAVTLDSYESFYYSEAYKTYSERFNQCLAAEALKAAIEEAKANYVDVSEAASLYNDESSQTWEMAEAAEALRTLINIKYRLKVAIQEAEAQGFPGADEFKAVLYDKYADYDEVQNAINNLNYALIEWGKENASLENPADMTSMIVNPRFDNNDVYTGWNPGFNSNNSAENAEFWNTNYNTYQYIYNLPEGVYALGVNAFYRAGSNYSTAVENWLANNEASKYAKLYVETDESYRQKPIANICSGAQLQSFGVGETVVTYIDPQTQEEVTVYLPNTMSAAEYYMHTLGQYGNKLIFAVREGSGLRIGVSKNVTINDDWSLFDDFSLTYYGKAADAYQYYLVEAIKDYEVSIEDGVLFTQAYLNDYNGACNADVTVSSLDEVNEVLWTVEYAKSETKEHIIFKITENKNIKDKYYILYINISELNSLNALFSLYQNIEEIYTLLLNLIIDNKYSISLKNNSIILLIKLPMPGGKIIDINFELRQNKITNEEILDLLYSKVNELIKENQIIKNEQKILKNKNDELVNKNNKLEKDYDEMKNENEKIKEKLKKIENQIEKLAIKTTNKYYDFDKSSIIKNIKEKKELMNWISSK